jgi:hypothetical protein
MLTPRRHRELWDSLGYEPDDAKYEPTEKDQEILYDDRIDIEMRTKEIRAKWSAEEEANRLVGTGGRIPWTLPEYYVEYVSADPGSISHRKHIKTKIYKRLE